MGRLGDMPMTKMTVKMTVKNLGEMTIDELWEEIELWFEGIEGTVGGRSYGEHSATGVRYVELQVRKHLTYIDRLLLEIEGRAGGRQ